MADDRPVAVFDSGVGGISVLGELVRRMPTESFLYFGDSANSPYGSRSEAQVRAWTFMHTARLLDADAKAVVIACNTATGAAIGMLRRHWPEVPIIGIEPAIKPAAAAHPGGRILVMATPVTLASRKFRELLARHAGEAEFLEAPCPRLAAMVESGILDGAETEAYLRQTLRPFLGAPADAVVLGCTHYPFVRRTVARVTGTEEIYDGGAGTARETARRLAEAGLQTDAASPGTVTFLSSDPSEEHRLLCERLLAAARAGASDA
jgi:glutamate racemase